MTLAHYQEPVGTFIGNGQHFVLTTAVEADQDPNSNFYANILNMLVRDPLLDPGPSPYTGNRVTYAYDTAATNSWYSKFTRYGWTGSSPNAAPYTTGAGSGYVDDPEVGSFVSRPSAASGWKGFWWGRYVVVKRDDTATSPTDDAWFFAQ